MFAGTVATQQIALALALAAVVAIAATNSAASFDVIGCCLAWLHVPNGEHRVSPLWFAGCAVGRLPTGYTARNPQ